MRKNLLVTSMVAVMFMFFTQCSENEVVAPDNQVQSDIESSDRENAAARKSTGKYLATPVTGTINGLPFTAEYHITEFVHENNTALYALATITNISGVGLPAEAEGLIGQQVRIPVQLPENSRTAASGRIVCDVLMLDLGPLDLDLLGLQIHLDQVVLEIVAEAAAGNLLGNLLCAVVSLLDGIPAIAAIAQLLNNIIDLIGLLPS